MDLAGMVVGTICLILGFVLFLTGYTVNNFVTGFTRNQKPKTTLDLIWQNLGLMMMGLFCILFSIR